MKKFLLGFIAGALVFSFIPAFGAALEQYILYKPDYKVYVNGVEYKDTEKPVLNYKGIFYMPVLEFTQNMGINSEINIKSKRIDFNYKDEVEIPINDATGLPVGALYLNNSKNNISYRTIWFNQENYISTEDLLRVYSIFPTSYNTKENTVTFCRGNKQIVIDLGIKLNKFNVGSVSYYKLSLFKDIAS